MDNMDKKIEDAAERAHDYVGILISLFKQMNVNPLEALTSTIVASAVIARGLDLPRENINEVLTATFDDVYSVEASKL